VAVAVAEPVAVAVGDRVAVALGTGVPDDVAVKVRVLVGV
jgi:hypothetical protein